MQIKLGDQYSVPNAASGPAGLVVEIKRLGTKEVHFAVSGHGVHDPQKLREMPTTAFVIWLRRTKARQLKAATTQSSDNGEVNPSAKSSRVCLL